MGPELRLLSFVVILLVALPFVSRRLKKERDAGWDEGRTLAIPGVP
jgi:hypothetical protein